MSWPFWPGVFLRSTDHQLGREDTNGRKVPSLADLCPCTVMLASTSLLPLPDLRQSRLGVTTTTVARSLPPAVLLIEAEAVLSGDAPRDPFLLCSGIVAVVSALVVLSFLGYLVWVRARLCRDNYCS